MLYQIAICDDNPADAAYLTGLVEEWAAASHVAVSLEAFPSAEAFLFRCGDAPPLDMLLRDIEMGEMDGVARAKTLRQKNDLLQIIFVTGFADYIADGYDVSALHYLLKPASQEKLFEVLSRAKDRLQRADRFLAILTAENGGNLCRLPLREIRFLEAQQNYVIIHAGKDYTVRRPLSELEKELDERFFRTGRSFILNLAAVRQVGRRDVTLSDGTSLPLPRGMYEPLNRAIINYH